MRAALAKSKGDRKRFRGIFVRTGKKTNYHGYATDTILLRDIADLADNTKVTDHAWFTFTKGFEVLSFHEGDIIEFDARVKEYKKGYVNKKLQMANRKTDYRLSHPTKIVVIKKN